MYVKLINGQIEPAPYCKDGIHFFYNSSPEVLKSYNYKQLRELPEPIDGVRISYTEDEDYVYENQAQEDIEAFEIQKKELCNAKIKAQLAEIDLKSIRALRTGEVKRLAELEAEAVELRGKLK